MNAYHFTQTLQSIWQDAVERYRAGDRGAETFFSPETVSLLASIGLKPIEVYDFAEDFANSGDPDFTTFAMICEARRDFFLTVQNGIPSEKTVTMNTLPPKDAAVEGIEWLPRIIPKASAKLRGEMERDLMYCCGGDRRFFKQHDIHPAEFLRVVWAYEESPEKIVEWVQARSAHSKQR